MGDRVRSGLFASLASMDAVAGATVLDAFAGTGAMGLEALSRGAANVMFIERDKVAARLIAVNIDTLGVGDRTKLIKSSVASWLETSDDINKFNLIMADPPYHQPQLATITRLFERLDVNGLMVVSLPTNLDISQWELADKIINRRSYGKACIYHIKR